MGDALLDQRKEKLGIRLSRTIGAGDGGLRGRFSPSAPFSDSNLRKSVKSPIACGTKLLTKEWLIVRAIGRSARTQRIPTSSSKRASTMRDW
jgi:hypothetical protein